MLVCNEIFWKRLEGEWGWWDNKFLVKRNWIIDLVDREIIGWW